MIMVEGSEKAVIIFIKLLIVQQLFTVEGKALALII